MEIEKERSEHPTPSLPSATQGMSQIQTELTEQLQPAEVAKMLSSAIWGRIVTEIETLSDILRKKPLFTFQWKNRSTGNANGAAIAFKDGKKSILELFDEKGMQERNENLDLKSAPSVLAPNTTRIGPRFTANKNVFKLRNIINIFDLDEGRLSLCSQSIPNVSKTGANLPIDFDKSLLENFYSEENATNNGRAFHAELNLFDDNGELGTDAKEWRGRFKREREHVFSDGENDGTEAAFLKEVIPGDDQDCIDRAYALIAKGDPEKAVDVFFGVDADADMGLENLRKLVARVLWLLAARWITLLGAFGYRGEGKNFPDYIPGNKDLSVLRPVALKPPKLVAQLEEDGIFMPYSVIVAACAALNAGKHLILTGPPGNGKTTLAKKLAVSAKSGGDSTMDDGDCLLSVTASPSWTTAEMIGRYLPNPNPGTSGLEFIPGFYQEAIDDNKWLLIDEFNRADMDQCFGELFTVLSGQDVTLPFKRIRSDEEGDAAGKVFEQVLLPKPPGDFRIIATMNDVDAGQLNTLSFALRRRFVILNIDVPDDMERKKIFSAHLRRRKILNSNQSWNPYYIVTNSASSSTQSPRLLIDNLKKHLTLESNSLFHGLFMADAGNLLDERIVGIAQATDMIDFIIESLRDPDAKSDDFSETPVSTLDLQRNDLLDLIASNAAMAVCLLIFPQLDACDNDHFGKALQILNTTFGKSRKFLLIQNKAGKYSVEQGKVKTIAEYLKIELLQQFKFDMDRCGIITRIFTASA